MSSGKAKVVAGALLALAMISSPVSAKKKQQMTPEEVKLYNLQLQQEQEQAAKYNATPQGQAEARARFDHDAQMQADRESAEGAETNRRLSPNYRPPAAPQQQMCSVNYGSTTGLVPCP